MNIGSDRRKVYFVIMWERILNVKGYSSLYYWKYENTYTRLIFHHITHLCFKPFFYLVLYVYIYYTTQHVVVGIAWHIIIIIIIV